MSISAEVSPSAADLRNRLVDDLAGDGTIVSAAVESAFRTVPRHLFAPGVPLDQVYARAIVLVKRDQHGVPVSTISAPEIQARMLEQAAIEPGMRVLEIGSGVRHEVAHLQVDEVGGRPQCHYLNPRSVLMDLFPPWRASRVIAGCGAQSREPKDPCSIQGLQVGKGRAGELTVNPQRRLVTIKVRGWNVPRAVKS